MKTKLAVLVIALLVASIVAPLAFAQPNAPNGPWVDEVVFFAEKDRAKAVDMLSKGDMHLYFIDVSDPQIFQKAKADPNINYKFAYGLYYELTFNPVGPVFKNGEFNPFFDPKIREAMNYIIDRNYIANEIMQGLAAPMYVPITYASVDYARFIDVIKSLEIKYKYNFEKGKEIIFKEMMKLGAEYKNGKWYYKGKPVVIHFIIRTEDKRKEIGDYIASQLEKLGFTVDRMYKTSRQASPLWLFGNPADGKWTLYTGGWIQTAISRDDAGNFAFFYTPLGIPLPLWQAYKPSPQFYEVAKKLYENKFNSIEERNQLMTKALIMALQDSVRVWLVNQKAPFLLRKGVEVASDLSGGFATNMWSRTIRFTGKVGGTIKAGNSEVLVDPWNPVAGSDWVYDTVVYQATRDFATLPNPYNGLPVPDRMLHATVYVLSNYSTLITKSSDWLDLNFVDKITVPSDAWYAYDPVNDKIITAGEANVTEAKVKVVVNYGDVIGKVKFHDGTTMTLADWLVGFPLTFARVNPKSGLYDEAAVGPFQSWRKNFVAWKIVSVHPLIIEYYINYINLEAEFIADWAAGYPAHPLEMMAIGIKADAEHKLAFSADKADKLKVEWMNYIGGPSIPVLKQMLDEAKAEGYIPFKGFLGKYITVDEVKQRYQNLENWFKAHGHFWVGDGPFYLDKVDYNAHQAVIKAFRQFIDKADRFAGFVEPMVPEVSIKAPDVVISGLKADFDLSVTYKGKPYPMDKMWFVKYLVFDSAGQIVAKGEAKAVADGKWKIELPASTTINFGTGSYKLLVLAVSKEAIVPSQAEQPFTVTSQMAYIKGQVAQIQSSLQAKLGSLENGITQLNSKVSTLEGEINAVKGNVNIAMILGIIGIILAAIALAKAFKKS